MKVDDYIDKIVTNAKKASQAMSTADSALKNTALKQMADNITRNKASLMAENEKDIKAAEEAGLSSAMIDRLKLTDPRIEDMAEGIRQVINLTDPVGEIMEELIRPNGLQI